MECNFVVGQKVVCIDDDPKTYTRPGLSYTGDLDGLTRGKIYTIRGIYVGSIATPDNNAVCLYLNEIVRPVSFLVQREAGYRAARFRHVREIKTDISVFNEILRKANEENKIEIEV
jgi:hypothetical protein